MTWCWLVGHRWLVIAMATIYEQDSGIPRSTWTGLQCQRCLLTRYEQWDW